MRIQISTRAEIMATNLIIFQATLEGLVGVLVCLTSLLEHQILPGNSCTNRGPMAAVKGVDRRRRSWHTNSALFHTGPPFSAFLQNISACTPFSWNAMVNPRQQTISITTLYTRCTSTVKETTSVKFGCTCGQIGTPLRNGGSGCDQHIPTPSHASKRPW